jgi:hypothetical protein
MLLSLLRLFWLLLTPFVLAFGLALAGYLYQVAARRVIAWRGIGNARAAVRQRPYMAYWPCALIVCSSLYMQLVMSFSGERFRLSLFDGLMIGLTVLIAAASLTRLELRSNRLIEYWPFGKVRREIPLDGAEVVNDTPPWYLVIFLGLEAAFPLLRALIRKQDFHAPGLDPYLRIELPGGEIVRLRSSALPDDRETFMIAVDVRIARLFQQAQASQREEKK